MYRNDRGEPLLTGVEFARRSRVNGGHLPVELPWT
jgi:hypothetical protein